METPEQKAAREKAEAESKSSPKPAKDPHAPVKVKVTSIGFKHQETHGAKDVPVGTVVELTPGQAASASKNKLVELID